MADQAAKEQKKKEREIHTIDKKEGETIYRHYGQLIEGWDFKIRNSKNCEIYILDCMKGMFIDNCENCKIVVGPIEGSLFVRTSKNCEISVISHQVRFRDCENIKIFTYCPNDPVVESSFNIYFAPFNAYFPHLKELFKKYNFNPNESNHINSVYDFTQDKVMGDGAPHFLPLPKEQFYIKTVRDGSDPVEEMFEGYSQSEEWIRERSNEIPDLTSGERGTNDFDFMGENKEEKKPEINDILTGNNQNNDNESGFDFSSYVPLGKMMDNNLDMFNTANSNNNNNNNIMNMDDFLSEDNKNNNTNQNNNNDLNDFFSGTTDNKKSNNNTNNNLNNFFSGPSNNNLNNNMNMSNMNYNMNMSNNMNMFKNMDMSNNMNITNNKVDEEEMRRLEKINKEKEKRKTKLKEKIEKEDRLRKELRAKASEYMKQFLMERQQRMDENHQKILEQQINNNMTFSSGNDPWGAVQSSIDKNSSAERMREAIINKNKGI